MKCVKCFTTLVQFVRPGESDAVCCCPMIHRHRECYFCPVCELSVAHFHHEWDRGITDIDGNLPKTQGFMGTQS